MFNTYVTDLLPFHRFQKKKGARRWTTKFETPCSFDREITE